MSTAARTPAILHLFRATLFALAVAAITGLVFRGVLAWGWDLGASLVNIRHAHSHLMFFGWITPALFVLLASGAAALRRRPVSRAARVAIGASLALGMTTHPLFLRFGYESVAIGSARLPLAAIASGLAVIAWYAFVLVWVRERRGAPRTAATFAWDLALVVLVLSTLAVWPLSVLRPLGIDPAQWTPILLHAFLDPFSEGWLVLALLGLAHAELGGPARRPALVVIAVSAPLAFGLGVPRGLLPEAAYGVASVASIAWAVALLVALDGLRRSERARSWRWRVPLALGALAALGKLAAGLTPFVDWSATHGLRLVYLHALLFGFVSLGALGAARFILGARAVPALQLIHVTALATIASLLPLSEAWPERIAGGWSAGLAASVAAVASMIFLASFAASLAPRPPAPAPA